MLKPLVEGFMFPGSEAAHLVEAAQIFYIPVLEADLKVPTYFYSCKSGSFVLIVYAHGNGTDVGALIDGLRAVAESCKVHMCAFEYPGYGKCAGQASEVAVDGVLTAIMDFIQARLHWPLKNIVLWGTSIGSGCCVRYCKRLAEGAVQPKQAMRRFPVYSPETSLVFVPEKEPVSQGTNLTTQSNNSTATIRTTNRTARDIGGLILQCPLRSIQMTAQKFVGSIMTKLLVAKSYDNDRDLPSCRCPLLIIHGKEDELFDWRGSSAMFEKYEGGPKMLYLIEEVDHNTFDWDRDLARPVKRFLKEVVNPALVPVAIPRTSLRTTILGSAVTKPHLPLEGIAHLRPNLAETFMFREINNSTPKVTPKPDLQARNSDDPHDVYRQQTETSDVETREPLPRWSYSRFARRMLYRDQPMLRAVEEPEGPKQTYKHVRIMDQSYESIYFESPRRIDEDLLEPLSEDTVNVEKTKGKIQRIPRTTLSMGAEDTVDVNSIVAPIPATVADACPHGDSPVIDTFDPSPPCTTGTAEHKQTQALVPNQIDVPTGKRRTSHGFLQLHQAHVVVVLSAVWWRNHRKLLVPPISRGRDQTAAVVMKHLKLRYFLQSHRSAVNFSVYSFTRGLNGLAIYIDRLVSLLKHGSKHQKLPSPSGLTDKQSSTPSGRKPIQTARGSQLVRNSGEATFAEFLANLRRYLFCHSVLPAVFAIYRRSKTWKLDCLLIDGWLVRLRGPEGKVVVEEDPWPPTEFISPEWKVDTGPYQSNSLFLRFPFPEFMIVPILATRLHDKAEKRIASLILKSMYDWDISMSDSRHGKIGPNNRVYRDFSDFLRRQVLSHENGFVEQIFSAVYASLSLGWPPQGLSYRGGTLGSICPFEELVVRIFSNNHLGMWLAAFCLAPDLESAKRLCAETATSHDLIPAPELTGASDWTRVAPLMFRWVSEMKKPILHTKNVQFRKEMQRLVGQGNLHEKDWETILTIIFEVVIYPPSGVGGFKFPQPRLPRLDWRRVSDYWHSSAISTKTGRLVELQLRTDPERILVNIMTFVTSHEGAQALITAYEECRKVEETSNPLICPINELTDALHATDVTPADDLWSLSFPLSVLRDPDGSLNDTHITIINFAWAKARSRFEKFIVPKFEALALHCEDLAATFEIHPVEQQRMMSAMCVTFAHQWICAADDPQPAKHSFEESPGTTVWREACPSSITWPPSATSPHVDPQTAVLQDVFAFFMQLYSWISIEKALTLAGTRTS